MKSLSTLLTAFLLVLCSSANGRAIINYVINQQEEVSLSKKSSSEGDIADVTLSQLEEYCYEGLEKSYRLVFDSMLVTCQGANHTYLSDGEHAMMLYGKSGLTTGDCISGDITGISGLYYGTPEFKIEQVDVNVQVLSSGNKIPRKIVSATELSQNTKKYMNKYIRIYDVHFSESFTTNDNFRTLPFFVEDQAFKLFNLYNHRWNINSEKAYCIDGIVSLYNSTIQVAPLREKDLRVMRVDNIAGLIDVEVEDSIRLSLTDAHVLYSQSGYTFVQDESGATLFYGMGLSVTAGNILNGYIDCTYHLYNQTQYELIPNAATDLSTIQISDGGVVVPEERTIEEALDKSMFNHLVTLKGLTIRIDGNRYYGQKDGYEIQIYNRFGYILKFSNGSIVDVTGVIFPYGNVIEIYPTQNVIDPDSQSLIEVPHFSSLSDVSVGDSIRLSLNDAQILFSQSGYTFVQDESGAALFYSMDIPGYAGQKMNGYIDCTYHLYNQTQYELITNAATDLSTIQLSDGGAVVPEDRTIEEALDGSLFNHLVTLKGLTIRIDGNRFYGQKDGKEIQIINKFGFELNVSEGSIANVTGVIIPYRNVIEIYPTQNVVDASTLTINVLDENNTNVTKDVSVIWYNVSGEQIAIGTSLGGVKNGETVFYSILLNDQLGRIYKEVYRQKVVASGDPITCQLSRIEKTILHGKVQAYGTPIYKASIEAFQWLNKKYDYTTKALTNENGEFSLEVFNDSTELHIAAKDYIDKKTVRTQFNNGGELGSIELEEVKGKVVVIDLSYQVATRDGEIPNIANWYSDTRNIEYNVRNLTKNVDVPDFSIQQGNIVLPKGADNGDEIQITAHSLNEKFADVTSVGVIAANDTATISLKIVAMGGFEASYQSKGNDDLLAMLYDNEGKLVMRSLLSSSRITFAELKAGSYTLLSMGYNGAVGSIGSISDLTTLGLQQNIDYVLSNVTVTDGFISSITVSFVPELDASKFELTGDNTSYECDKSLVTVGKFVTLTARVNFKDQYAESVKNVKVVIDVPEGCEFVPNSAVIGTRALTYTQNGNKVYINLQKEDIDNRIRFCLMPSEVGTYISTASVEFDCKGEKSQPIGQSVFTISSGKFFVPETTAVPNITVRGIASPKAEVDIYDGDYVIGNTTALSDGKWSVECTLKNAYNLSTHNIRAVCQGTDGKDTNTESLPCYYDVNALYVKSVTMVNTYHTTIGNAEKESRMVFDFVNLTTTPKSYPYWPQRPDFTFLIDLSQNDTTKISDVVLNVYTTDGGKRKLHAQYDGKQNCFVATSTFDTYSLPVNVSVHFNHQTEAILSSEYVSDAYSIFESTKDSLSNRELQINALRNEIKALEMQSDGDNSKLQELYKKYFSLLGVDMDLSNKEVDILNDEEIEKLKKQFDEFKKEYGTSNISGLLSQIYTGQLFEFEEKDLKGCFSTSTCDDYDEQNLDLNWQIIKLDDGSLLYVLNNESSTIILDFPKNICYTINYEESIALSRNQASGDAIEDLRRRIVRIGDILNNIKDKASKVFDVVENVISHIEAGERFAQEGYGSAWRQLQKLKSAKAAGEAISEQRIFLLELTCEGYEEEIKGLKSLKSGVSHLNSKFYGVIFGSIGLIQECIECQNDLNEFINLYYSVPEPCEADKSKANSIKNRIRNVGVSAAVYYIGNLSADVCSILGIGPAVATAPATAGSSLGVALAAIGKLALSWGIQEVYKRTTIGFKNNMLSEIASLKCKKKKDNDDDDDDDDDDRRHTEDGKDKHDPSGYVYEAVPTNRIEGVKASVYYEDNGPQFWNAEEYSEINPQITEEEGLYAWDVPKGMWKVIFEKEGYETTQTDWLPVPPPQLEINISMSQAVAPNVEDAKGMESGITLSFSKYMKPNTLTKSSRVSVTRNGKNVSGDVELLNLEENPFNHEEYVSKIKFIPYAAFATSDEVIITVKKEVESYANKQMTEDFVQRVNIESEITEIACDSIMVIDYQGTGILEVSVLPAAAAKSRTVQVTSTSPMIANTDVQSVTLNDEGKARITVLGELPGNASLHLSMPEAGKEKYVVLNVVTKEEQVVKTPKASKLSGSSFDDSYLLTLTCATKGSTIYYTLDGSCPCDEQTRKKYTAPISLPLGLVTLQAVAVREGMADSDIAEFTYTVTKDASGIKVIEESYDFECNYQDGSIIVTGAKGASCHIYDIQGRELGSRSKMGNQSRINVPKTDVYIVSVLFSNEQTVVRKIMAK